MATENTKVIPILKNGEETINTVFMDVKEREVVSKVDSLFKDVQQNRDTAFDFFNGRNLIQYLEDSVTNFNTNIYERDGIEDWQARIHVPITRNKVNAIFGRSIQNIPTGVAEARNFDKLEDIRRARVLTELYDYSEEISDGNERMAELLLEALVKGTAIGYEGHNHRVRKLRNVKGSGDKIKISKETVEENTLFTQVVKLEDFYPSSVSLTRIDDMPYCFWREEMPYNSFLKRFNEYKRTGDGTVQPFSSTEDNVPDYHDFISNNTQEGNVEVKRYYNQENDEYIIIANGRWLNPLEKDIISPLPFNHKKLPFFSFKFDLFGSGFFYGKSLVDKLYESQIIMNVLTNMILDQSFLSIFPPIVTNTFDDIEDDYLRPGRRISLDTQGLPIRDSIQELQISSGNGFQQFVLEYTKNIIEESSVDKVAQGSAGVGERTTAEEIRTAAAGIVSTLSYFGLQVKRAIKSRFILRTQNIIQIWMNDNKPIYRKIIGNDKDKIETTNNIQLLEAELSDGRMGRRVIQIRKDKKDLPTKEELETKKKIFEENTNEKIEIIAIPNSYLRNFQYDSKVIANKKQESTQQSEQALQLEKTRVYISLFPESVNPDYLLEQLALKMGDDPSKLIKKQEPMPEQEGANSEMVNPVGSKPRSNAAQNAVKSMAGGDIGSRQI